MSAILGLWVLVVAGLVPMVLPINGHTESFSILSAGERTLIVDPGGQPTVFFDYSFSVKESNGPLAQNTFDRLMVSSNLPTSYETYPYYQMRKRGYVRPYYPERGPIINYVGIHPNGSFIFNFNNDGWSNGMYGQPSIHNDGGVFRTYIDVTGLTGPLELYFAVMDYVPGYTSELRVISAGLTTARTPTFWVGENKPTRTSFLDANGNPMLPSGLAYLRTTAAKPLEQTMVLHENFCFAYAMEGDVPGSHSGPLLDILYLENRSGQGEWALLGQVDGSSSPESWLSASLRVPSDLWGVKTSIRFAVHSCDPAPDPTVYLKNIHTYTYVPEPTTVLLFGIGLAGVLIMRSQTRG